MAKRYDRITEVNKNIDHIEEVEKFNPWHDSLGRFTSGNGFMASNYAGDKSKQARTFSANPNTRAGAMAIARHGNGLTGHEVISEAFDNPAVPKKETKPKDTKPAKPKEESNVEYKKVSGQEVREMRQEMHSDMSFEDRQIVTDRMDGFFQTSNSFRINRKLNNDRELAPEDQRTVDAMDRNMKPMTKNIKVQRMVDTDFLESITGKDSWEIDEDTIAGLVGGKVTNKGFMSTSYDMRENVFRNREVTLNFNVPKGAKAMVSPTGEEAEIVLARNTQFKIKGAKMTTDRWGFRKVEIDADVLVA